MAEIIRGTCLLMCPDKERLMREKEGLLHKFEIDDKTKHLSRPNADPLKTIKCFSRSAAGQILTDPKQLRPAPILLSTARYLFTQIATSTDIDWTDVYDFIFDRLRSIRQDITIQRIDTRTSIYLYELFVRFHAYAAQRLCELNIRQFDPKINDQHLSECIMQLFQLYNDLHDISISRHHSMEPCTVEGMERLMLYDNRPQMEALYVLVHIGDVTALNRGLKLPPELRNSKNVQLAMKISLAWYLRNYTRACRLIRQLPPILLCAAMCKFRSLRREALRIMSSAYNSSVLIFPAYKLQELLLYNSENRIAADCALFGLEFTKGGVLFQKSKFNDKIPLANPEMYYSLQTMHNFLSQIILTS